VALEDVWGKRRDLWGGEPYPGRKKERLGGFFQPEGPKNKPGSNLLRQPTRLRAGGKAGTLCPKEGGGNAQKEENPNKL